MTPVTAERLVLAARDVVLAWDDHTEGLDTAIRRLAAAIQAASRPVPEPSPAGL